MKLKSMCIFITIVFNMQVNGQNKTFTKFPILKHENGIGVLWNEYRKIENVKLVDQNGISFDLNSGHYRVKAYPNCVKVFWKHNKNTSDSLVSSKVLLFPSDNITDKVIAVQVTYFYNSKSTKPSELVITPLILFENLVKAKKEYEISE